MTRYLWCAALALLALPLAACSVDETTAPPLAGPSEFALGITVHATPDSLLQDGVSQSAIVIDAKGPDGQPARNVALRVEITIDGTPQDFGKLSTKTTITDGNGQARLTYTAPPKPTQSVDVGTRVTIRVTPQGNDYRAAMSRQVDIRLIPPGLIVAPGPVPNFTIAPSPATIFSPVHFDASESLNGGVACEQRCSYAWNFDDGIVGTGMTVDHVFRDVGIYAIALTVTDTVGNASTVVRSLSVEGGEAPTATFTFSPTKPELEDTIFFNASESKVAAGRQIVSYQWDFGDGQTDSGVTTSRRYGKEGTFVVTLTVTDDVHQTGSASKEVPVGVTTDSDSKGQKQR